MCECVSFLLLLLLLFFLFFLAGGEGAGEPSEPFWGREPFCFVFRGAF